MYQINRVPLALSDLIGAKAWTTNPASMNDALQLVYDSKLEFLMSRSEVVQYSSNTNAVGAVAALLCPSDQLWFVHSAAAQISVGAGGQAKFRLMLAYQPGGSLIPWHSSNPVTVLASEQGGVGIQYNNYLPPRTQGLSTGIYFQLDQVTLLGHSYTVAAMITRITV